MGNLLAGKNKFNRQARQAFAACTALCITPLDTTLHQITLHHTTSHLIRLHHSITPHHVGFNCTRQHITPHHTASHGITPHRTASQRITPHHSITLHDTTPVKRLMMRPLGVVSK